MTIDITDQLLELAERQAVYLEAVAGEAPATEQDALRLALFLVAKATFDGDLSGRDKTILLEMGSHSAISYSETLRRFYAAVLEASIAGTVDCPPVITTTSRLLRP